MKKLRMIVTSVVVLAILSSAYAFKIRKTHAFCVSANNTSTDCTAILDGSKRTTSTVGTPLTRKYFCAWDGASVTSCTNDGGIACSDGPGTFTAD